MLFLNPSLILVPACYRCERFREANLVASKLENFWKAGDRLVGK